MTFLSRRGILFLSTARWIASVAFPLFLLGQAPSACLKQYHEERGGGGGGKGGMSEGW